MADISGRGLCLPERGHELLPGPLRNRPWTPSVEWGGQQHSAGHTALTTQNHIPQCEKSPQQCQELQATEMSRAIRVLSSQDAKSRRKLSDGLTVVLNCCSEAARLFSLIRPGAATIHTGHTSDTDIIKENTPAGNTQSIQESY